MGCSHAPDATHVRGAPWPRDRALHVAALRCGGNQIDWNPGSAGRSRSGSISTTRPRQSRSARLGPSIAARRGSSGRGAQSIRRRSAPITGVADEEEDLRRVCGAAVYDELAAYCRVRRNGERCRRRASARPEQPCRVPCRHQLERTRRPPTPTESASGQSDILRWTQGVLSRWDSGTSGSSRMRAQRDRRSERIHSQGASLEVCG